MTCESSECLNRRHSSYLCPLWRFFRTIGCLFSALITGTSPAVRGDELGWARKTPFSVPLCPRRYGVSKSRPVVSRIFSGIPP